MGQTKRETMTVIPWQGVMCEGEIQMWGYGYILGIGVSLAYWIIFVLPMDRSFRKRKLALARKRIRKSIAKNLVQISQPPSKSSAFELVKQFPITGKVEGWHFRINEISRKNFLGERCHTCLLYTSPSPRDS